MKKSIYLIALSIISLLFLSSCESGNTESNNNPDLGGNVIQTPYNGFFAFKNDELTGTVRLDIQEDSSGAIVGNISYSRGVCLCDGDLTGSRDGASLNLTTGTCTLNYRPTDCSVDSREPDGRCPEETETGRARFLLSGTQARLTGSFTVSGGVCTIAASLPASGTISLFR